jgi:hypothetical protein
MRLYEHNIILEHWRLIEESCGAYSYIPVLNQCYHDLQYGPSASPPSGSYARAGTCQQCQKFKRKATARVHFTIAGKLICSLSCVKIRRALIYLYIPDKLGRLKDMENIRSERQHGDTARRAPLSNLGANRNAQTAQYRQLSQKSRQLLSEGTAQQGNRSSLVRPQSSQSASNSSSSPVIVEDRRKQSSGSTVVRRYRKDKLLGKVRWRHFRPFKISRILLAVVKDGCKQ